MSRLERKPEEQNEATRALGDKQDKKCYKAYFSKLPELDYHRDIERINLLVGYEYVAALEVLILAGAYNRDFGLLEHWYTMLVIIEEFSKSNRYALYYLEFYNEWGLDPEDEEPHQPKQPPIQSSKRHLYRNFSAMF
jgi:hypothetical protein